MDVLPYDISGEVLRSRLYVVLRAARRSDRLFSKGSVVDVQQLLPDQPLEQKAASPARAGRLDEIQRDHILSVLRTTRGVIEGARGAATILGIHPNTLRSRMKKLGHPPRRRRRLNASL